MPIHLGRWALGVFPKLPRSGALVLEGQCALSPCRQRPSIALWDNATDCQDGMTSYIKHLTGGNFPAKQYSKHGLHLSPRTIGEHNSQKYNAVAVSVATAWGCLVNSNSVGKCLDIFWNFKSPEKIRYGLIKSMILMEIKRLPLNTKTCALSSVSLGNIFHASMSAKYL